MIAELKPRFPDIKQSILHALENHAPIDHWTATPRLYAGVYESDSPVSASQQPLDF